MDSGSVQGPLGEGDQSATADDLMDVEVQPVLAPIPAEGNSQV